MEGELIFVGFIMLIGQIILMYMWNANWFKKENFKMQKQLVMKQNNLKLKKLEKDFGLQGATKIAPEAKGWGELLQNIDSDKIKDILSIVQGGDEESEGGIGDLINNIPPEVIEGFLKGAKNGKKEPEFTPQV